MVAAKRENNIPGVAACQTGRRRDDSTPVSGDIYSFDAIVDLNASLSFTDRVFAQYQAILMDPSSPNSSDFSSFEAFSKLDTKSLLITKTQVIVRILSNEKRTEGIRVLTFGASKDQRYGSKAGYKPVTLDNFSLNTSGVVQRFINTSNQLGLDVSFYENKDLSIVKAGGFKSDSYAYCHVVVEYVKSKKNEAVFRRANSSSRDTR